MLSIKARQWGLLTLISLSVPFMSTDLGCAAPDHVSGKGKGNLYHFHATKKYINSYPAVYKREGNRIVVTASPKLVPAPQITSVKWFSNKRVAMWVYSPAMKDYIQVQMLLPREWNSSPEETFPTLYMLDGMEARDDQNGWLLNTTAEKFFADKNALIVLPVGGESSFYTDWKHPDNGKTYKWETFLTKELPPLLEKNWRANLVRGIEGPSMGGTAAMTLAARHPGFYAYAGSFSGLLDLSAPGIPVAVQMAMRQLGNYNSAKMYGLPSDKAWAQHDPTVLAPKLRGTTLYVSSGNGSKGALDKDHNFYPTSVTDTAGLGLEMLSRVSSEQFASKLNQLSIPAVVAYRPSGTHSWPYWQFEMEQSWPVAAQALKVTPMEECKAGGAIGTFAAHHRVLGSCLTPEYVSGSARVQDFRGGRVIWSPHTKAHIVKGAIGGAYIGNGSTVGDLGLPIDEAKPTGKVWIQHFEHGMIVWSSRTGARPVFGAIAKKWIATGGVKNPLGLPVGEEVDTNNNVGKVQNFEHGAIYFSPGVGTHAVVGDFYRKYAQQKWEQGILGLPISDQKNMRGYSYQKFAGGNLYKTRRGTFEVPNGAIMNAWGAAGYERGRLGLPNADFQIIPGGSAQSFAHGGITIVNGVTNYT